MNFGPKINYIIGGVVVLALLAGGIWYWQKRELPVPDKNAEEKGLGATIFESSQNPLKEKLPDTNPFSANTNPFDAETNPFNAEYKNPFK